MKKFVTTFKHSMLLISLFCLVGLSSQAQTTTLYQGFDNYDGTLQSVPVGWYMRWNSASAPSFYNSTNNYGSTAPSYKFGIDQDTMITEAFTTSDTLSFWCKGEGASFSMYDTLTILWSPDNVIWNVLTYQDNLPTSPTTLTFPVNHLATRLMFIFTKYLGNLAMDDLKLTYDSTTGIQENQSPAEPFIIYPNPSSSAITICTNSGSLLIITDVLGQEIYHENVTNTETHIKVSEWNKGIYFYEIKTDKGIARGKFIKV